MRRACAACGNELVDGSGTCGSCATVGRVRHFGSAAALDAFQADRRLHGDDPRRRRRHGPYRRIAPLMVLLGAAFLLTGAVQAYAAARAGAGVFGLATIAGAAVPVASGVALLALARRLRGRETP